METRPVKILVVDDEPDLVTSLRRLLELNGFDVECAHDGKEAVEKNLAWGPDAVVMDVRMPRQNGIDACLEILRDRKEVVVILMTGFSDALDEANESIFTEAGRSGRVEVMMKPLKVERIFALLDGRGFKCAGS